MGGHGDRGPASQGKGDAAKSASPFVEAYLEYQGPPERWAGPGTVLVHLVAHDLNHAELTVRPDLLTQIYDQGEQMGIRRISSTQPRPTGQVARERLSYLAESILNEKTAFYGCLYPIRARLVRGDGSVVEKMGCRSLQGWPSIASRTVSEMFTIALRDKGTSGEKTPARAVAAEKPQP